MDALESMPADQAALAIHRRQDVLEAARFCTGIKALNKGRRFAYSDNGSAVAVLEDCKWKACFEKVITGQWIYGGLDVERKWIELP